MTSLLKYIKLWFKCNKYGLSIKEYKKLYNEYFKDIRESRGY